MHPYGAIQIANIRLAAIGKLDPLEIARVPADVSDPVPYARRPVWLDKEHGFVETPIYDGTLLTPRQKLTGPAIIEEATTTIFVGPGDRLKMTDAGNYHVDIDYAGAQA